MTPRSLQLIEQLESGSAPFAGPLPRWQVALQDLMTYADAWLAGDDLGEGIPDDL